MRGARGGGIVRMGGSQRLRHACVDRGCQESEGQLLDDAVPKDGSVCGGRMGEGLSSRSSEGTMHHTEAFKNQ